GPKEQILTCFTAQTNPAVTPQANPASRPLESRKPACSSSTMSKSARPDKAQPWLKKALPWLWSDDSITKHIRYGSALVAIVVFGLSDWAATDEIVSAIIAQGSVGIDSNVKKVQHPTGGVVGQLYVHDGDHAVAVPSELADTLDEPDVKEALASERKLFEVRRLARLGQQGQLKQRIGQLNEQVAGLTAQMQANDKELALAEQELQGTRDL